MQVVLRELGHSLLAQIEQMNGSQNNLVVLHLDLDNLNGCPDGRRLKDQIPVQGESRIVLAFLKTCLLKMQL